MSALRQAVAVTGMNLRSIPARYTTSLVIVIGIAAVVAVLISVLAMVVVIGASTVSLLLDRSLSAPSRTLHVVLIAFAIGALLWMRRKGRPSRPG